MAAGTRPGSWLPLIAVAFDVDIPPTPEVELLADRTGGRSCTSRVPVPGDRVPGPPLIEIENAHHMDDASAELLSYLTGESLRVRGCSRSRAASRAGFDRPRTGSVVRIELKPLAPQDALRMAQLATEKNPLPAHVLEVVAKRSGGNPQFLRDLLRTAIESGGIAELPDSAEAAAMAQIDVFRPRIARSCGARRCSDHVHPRMLAWFADEGEAPRRRRHRGTGCTTCSRRSRTAICDSAARCCATPPTKGCPTGCVASSTGRRRAPGGGVDFPEEAAGILSLHHFEAGDYRALGATPASLRQRSRHLRVRRSRPAVFARAGGGGQVDDFEGRARRSAEATGWLGTGREFRKASEAYRARLVANEPLAKSELLIKHSYVEEKLGKYTAALRSTDSAWALQDCRGEPRDSGARGGLVRDGASVRRPHR